MVTFDVESQDEEYDFTLFRAVKTLKTLVRNKVEKIMFHFKMMMIPYLKLSNSPFYYKLFVSITFFIKVCYNKNVKHFFGKKPIERRKWI